MDLTKVFDDVCAYQAIIETPAQMPRMAEIAVQKALVHRVVTRIELPADVIGEDVPSEHFTHPLIHELPRTRRSGGGDREGRRAPERPPSAWRSSAGIGCREAREQVFELAERLQAPIVHTLRAKDIFDTSEDPVVGMTGLIGNPAGYHAVNDCDVLLMLGTDFPYDEFLPGGSADHPGRPRHRPHRTPRARDRGPGRRRRGYPRRSSCRR